MYTVCREGEDPEHPVNKPTMSFWTGWRGLFIDVGEIFLKDLVDAPIPRKKRKSFLYVIFSCFTEFSKRI